MNSTFLKIETGGIYQVTNVLRQNHISGKILYISDPVVDGLYGDIVRPQIESVGCIEQEIVDNNTIAYSMNVAERVITTEVNCIVGMGGGKVLDVCKYAAYIAKTALLSIPTTATNDGLASPVAVLKCQDDRPKSLGCAIPSMVLVDLDVIAAGPKQLIKAGIGDTISNYMALQDWKLACDRGQDTMNEYAFLISQCALDSLMKSQYSSINSDFIRVLVNSLVISGIAMDLTGNSRPVSGSEHLFSHALDYYCPQKNLHGIQVALGTIAVLKLIGRDYSQVLSYLQQFEVDINPVHLGIEEDVFIYCMQNATQMRANRYTYLNEAQLDAPRLRTLYKQLVEELS